MCRLTLQPNMGTCCVSVYNQALVAGFFDRMDDGMFTFCIRFPPSECDMRLHDWLEWQPYLVLVVHEHAQMDLFGYLSSCTSAGCHISGEDIFGVHVVSDLYRLNVYRCIKVNLISQLRNMTVARCAKSFGV